MSLTNLSTASVELKLNSCEKEIHSLKENIDQLMVQLKKESPTLVGLINNIVLFNNTFSNNSNTIKLEFNQEVYNVVNSPNMSLLEMYYFLKDAGINQSTPEWDNRCLQLAEAIGRRLFYRDYDLSGNTRKDGTRIKDPNVFISGANNYWNDKTLYINGDYQNDPSLTEDAKNEILSTLYEELSNGRPCVLQVDNTSKDGTMGRHYVTVVGMKSDVTSFEDVTEDDFLILDPAGADFQQLGTKRHIYANKKNPLEANCRVLTLVDYDQVLENVNLARKEAGFNSKLTEIEEV